MYHRNCLELWGSSVSSYGARKLPTPNWEAKTQPDNIQSCGMRFFQPPQLYGTRAAFRRHPHQLQPRELHQALPWKAPTCTYSTEHRTQRHKQRAHCTVLNWSTWRWAYDYVPRTYRSCGVGAARKFYILVILGCYEVNTHLHTFLHTYVTHSW